MKDKTSSEYSRQLELQIKNRICAKHKTELTIAWINGKYVIRCSKGCLDPPLERVKSYWELYKAGEVIDPHVKQVFDRKEERRKR